MPATNQSTLISIFGDIATAIRGKLSVQTTYQPDDMAAAIASIPTGGWDGILSISISATPMQHRTISDQFGTRQDLSFTSSVNIVTS